MARKAHRRRDASTSPFRARQLTARPRDPDDEDYEPSPRDNPFDFIEWVRRRIEKPRFVYFIQEITDEDALVFGAVKIGQAFDPPSRLRELQCGNSRTLWLQAVIFATEDTEDSLHLVWRSVAGLRGEWFGRGFEAAIVELAKQAQRQQVTDFQSGMQPYQVATHGKWKVGHPRILAREAA